MMIRDRVSNEVAVIAKQKGYPTWGPYVDFTRWQTVYYYPKTGNRLKHGRTGIINKDSLIYVQEVDVMQNWLRKEKNINVFSIWDEEAKGWRAVIENLSMKFSRQVIGLSLDYNSALDYGFLIALCDMEDPEPKDIEFSLNVTDDDW